MSEREKKKRTSYYDSIEIMAIGKKGIASNANANGVEEVEENGGECQFLTVPKPNLAVTECEGIDVVYYCY